MKSKIIKVSIVLIFIMFSACLFNFCFAVTSDNKLEETDYTVTSSDTYNIVYTGNVTFNFINLNVNYEKINTNNTDDDLSNKYLDKAFYVLGNDKKLLCLIPEQYESTNDYVYNWYCTNQSDYSFTFDFPSVSNVYMHMYYYDFVTNKWIWVTSSKGSFAFNNNHYILDDNTVPIYSKKANATDEFIVYEPKIVPSIDMEINQTGSRTGHITFTPKNYDGSMYYIKGDKDRLDSLVSNGNISKNDSNVNYYSGPIYIEENEYVLGLIFDDDGNVIFSKISETIEYDPDFIFNDSHCLRLEQDDMDTYYLFIHSPQERRLYKSI